MAKYKPFALERYFAIHEFRAKYVACASDGDALSIKDILSMNNNDAESRELVNKLWYDMKLGYTESAGSPLLRKEVCNMYNSEYNQSNNIDIENVFIITPQEGIYITMKCLLNTNDHIIVLSPSYQSLYENALSNDISTTFWNFKLNSQHNFYLDIDELESKLIKPNKTKMIVINFPHNPTGFVPSFNEYCRILSIAKKYNIIIFSDEMYWFLFNETQRKYIKSAVMMNDDTNIITLSGISKTFCCPGLRIGWLITRNTEFMRKFQVFKDYITICCSAPSEVLSILALRNNNYLKIIERIQRIIAKNKDILYKFVRKNNDIFYWTQYDDNHYGGLTRFIGYKLSGILSVKAFCDRVVSECGVMLLPSTMYQLQTELEFRNRNRNNEFIRFGLGRKNLGEALDVLSHSLSEWREDHFRFDCKSNL